MHTFSINTYSLYGWEGLGWGQYDCSRVSLLGLLMKWVMIVSSDDSCGLVLGAHVCETEYSGFKSLIFFSSKFKLSPNLIFLSRY